ncbi:MAG: sulfotransferase family 2 domain-containing protein [Kiloniellales bacterium]
MDLTRDELLSSKIVFTHVSKAGGSSLFGLFDALLGPERCFRHFARDAKTGKFSRKIEDLQVEEVNAFNFLGGHFDYGHHARIAGRVFYIGTMRDPVDRIISSFYYLRLQGPEKLRAEAMSMTLNDYVQSKLEDPNSRIVRSSQVEQLTGEKTAEAAKAVIEEHYLACCSLEQLDAMQALLAGLYGKPEVTPFRLNVTKAVKAHPDLTLDTLETLHERFEEDYRLLAWVRDRFDRVYRHLQVADDAANPASAKTKRGGFPLFRSL